MRNEDVEEIFDIVPSGTEVNYRRLNRTGIKMNEIGLDFEKPIIELEKKIQEIKNFTSREGIRPFQRSKTPGRTSC
jgi:hypothetical protein